MLLAGSFPILKARFSPAFRSAANILSNIRVDYLAFQTRQQLHHSPSPRKVHTRLNLSILNSRNKHVERPSPHCAFSLNRLTQANFRTCSKTKSATLPNLPPARHRKPSNMATPELIEKATAFVYDKMSKYDASHDFDHIKRVVGCAHTIHSEIVATQPDHVALDLNLITLCALLRKYI